MAEHDPARFSFTSQGLALNYADWGNRDAPLLVLVHGQLDHARSWDDVARALREEWHVVAIDLRGHGDSAWSPDGAYGFAQYVFDLARFIEHLGGGDVTFVGHSLGAAIVLRYAALFPEKARRIVAIEGLGSSPAISRKREAEPVARRWRNWFDRRARNLARTPRRYGSIAEAVARMKAMHPRLPVETARHLAERGVRENPDGTFGWKFDDRARDPSPEETALHDREAFWRAVECPVLLVYGAESWASNPEEDGRAAHFRDARTVLFDGAGHWVHHDRTERFVAEVRRFL